MFTNLKLNVIFSFNPEERVAIFPLKWVHIYFIYKRIILNVSNTHFKKNVNYGINLIKTYSYKVNRNITNLKQNRSLIVIESRY
jgi:hypothetical protein